MNTLRAGLLALVVLVSGLALEVAEAQRRSGGRSYSSGGRSSSSRPSTSGRSYSSGGSRPSYTPSRPSTTPSAPAPNRPSTPSPSGKSYSSGGSSPPARPSGPPAPGPFSPSPRPTTPGGRSYSPPASTPGRPGGTFDAAAGKAQQRTESKKVFTQGQQPKPTYRAPDGTARPIDPRDRQIDALRRDLNHERWANRSYRQRSFFGPYYSYPPPVVVYRDPFSNLFWFWLLAQSLDTRSHWAYHHRQSMDDARYRELLRKDAQLEERVRQLEAKAVPRDPTYTPPGVERDLMFSDEYVEAAYNPQPAADDDGWDTAGPAQPPASPSISVGRMVWGGVVFLMKALFLLAAFAVLTFLVFFKRWGGAADPRRPNSRPFDERRRR